MFGLIAGIFKVIFGTLWLILAAIAITLRDFLEELGDVLFDNPDAWIFVLLCVLAIIFIRLFR